MSATGIATATRLAAWLLAVLLGGCASISPAPPTLPGTPPSTGTDAPVNYSFDVRFSGPLDSNQASLLRTLLQQHLDLARYRANDATLSRGELTRLVVATPAQAQALLETEGYFAASAVVQRDPDDDSSLRVIVTPGAQTRVTNLQLDFEEGLADPDAQALRDSLRRAWPLPAGAAYTQSQWAAGKNDLLVRARLSGFPLAHWAATSAQVDPDTQSAELSLTLASGARARLGELRIEGLKNQSELVVQRLAGFERGDPYTEQRLTEFQERLAKTLLFDAVRVQLQPEAVAADGSSPVLVSVQEAPLQQATVALGYHANTGQHISLEHLHRRPFGLGLRARSKLELGRDLRGAEFEISSHPQTDLHRNIASLQFEQDRSGGQIANNLGLRLGRLYEATQDERLSYVELLRARETVGTEVSLHRALSINQQWTRRRLDSTLLPTDGHQALALVGVGGASGSGGGPGGFGRVQFKLGVYQPLGLNWYGNARLEMAQVIAPERLGVPEKLLFRAGGDESVRGYAFHSLGPLQNGIVVGGRVLATGSVELARPLTLSFPSLWGAVFVDAGNAASRWADYKAQVGWGAGLRWRSPVGPLRVDVARAEATQKWRLHFSVGIAL